MSDNDLDFVIREAAPEFGDKNKLKVLIREDDDFRRAIIGDERVVRRVMTDEEILLKISPPLYFEILLRKTLKELESASHTVERIGGGQVPVFDAEAVVSLLAREDVLEYLADMLSSFTRIESYVIPVMVSRGVWKGIRFSDMDIDVLSRLCEAADEEQRFSFYKRMGDVCLFFLGVFPEYVQFDYAYPVSEEKRPKVQAWGRSMQDYEDEGRRFYRLAGQHRTAAVLDLAELLNELHENFNLAKKPLNYISAHFLRFGKRESLFPFLPSNQEDW